MINVFSLLAFGNESGQRFEQQIHEVEGETMIERERFEVKGIKECGG